MSLHKQVTQTNKIVIKINLEARKKAIIFLFTNPIQTKHPHRSICLWQNLNPYFWMILQSFSFLYFLTRYFQANRQSLPRKWLLVFLPTSPLFLLPCLFLLAILLSFPTCLPYNLVSFLLYTDRFQSRSFLQHTHNTIHHLTLARGNRHHLKHYGSIHQYLIYISQAIFA